jgi:hypothetical protein
MGLKSTYRGAKYGGQRFLGRLEQGLVRTG